MTGQALREESMSRTRKIESRKARQVKNKVKSMLIIFIDIKGSVHKEFILAYQTANSAHYCDVLGDCLKMCEDFAQDFGDKITGCSIITAHRLKLPFSPGNSLPKTTYLSSPNTPTFLIGRHFDTIEVIEAESLAVLTTLTEHDFQDEFKEW
jgi:hypothetical protein